MENIILDSTKKLQIKLQESAATQCDITVSYVDVNGSGVVVADGRRNQDQIVRRCRTFLAHQHPLMCATP